jgi:hypothetical protein
MKPQICPNIFLLIPGISKIIPGISKNFDY